MQGAVEETAPTSAEKASNATYLAQISESSLQLDVSHLTAAPDELIDRPLEQLDPVELAILLIGVYELESRLDIPYRVVINECVNLAKRFGSIDGHKYINACLDAAAKSLREIEIQAQG